MTAPVNVDFSSGTTISSAWLNGVNDYVNELNPTDHSSANVTYTPAGTGAVQTTVESKLQEIVSINDFGASPTASAAINNTAISSALASGATYITATPSSTAYSISDEFTIPAGVIFDGNGSKFLQTAASKNVFKFSSSNGAKLLNCDLQGYSVDTAPIFTLANGVFADATDRFEISGCTIHGFEYNGIYVQNCNDFIISKNIFYLNRYVNPTSADILVYSTSIHRGATITQNKCFSDNSQGIFVGVSGFDSDYIVTDNHCITLDSSFVYKAIPSRRHGIQLGYSPGTKRCVVANNILANTTSTGIYHQGTSNTATSSVLIANNYIKDTGINSTQPALSSGITLACQGIADIVTGNIIDTTYVGTSLGTSAGISLQPNNSGATTDQNRSTLITGNSIISAAGSGIQVINESLNAVVANNRISTSGYAGVYISISSIAGGVNNARVINNSILQGIATYGAVYITAGASVGSVEVSGNHLVGVNTTTNDVNNTGVFIANPNTASNNIVISGNYVRNFRCGVSTGFYLSAQLQTVIISNNTFVGLNTGIASGGTNGRLVGSGNQYISCTNNVGGGPLAGASQAWEGTWTNGSFSTYLSAAPTTGSWNIGDRTIRNPPAVGFPKAWSCTVAGTPGTWVSEGNL